MANLSTDIWQHDYKLRMAFSWLTRIGVAPKWGTMPIHYYQQDQCKAIEFIAGQARQHGMPLDRLRCKGGRIEAFDRKRWQPIAQIIRGELQPYTRV